MKLIIENIGSEIYVYRESEGHFAKMRRSEINRVDASELDDDCILDNVLRPGQYMAMDVIGVVRKRKREEAP